MPNYNPNYTLNKKQKLWLKATKQYINLIIYFKFYKQKIPNKKIKLSWNQTKYQPDQVFFICFYICAFIICVFCVNTRLSGKYTRKTSKKHQNHC